MQLLTPPYVYNIKLSREYSRSTLIPLQVEPTTPIKSALQCHKESDLGAVVQAEEGIEHTKPLLQLFYVI